MEMLKRKYGPLPGYAWAGIAVAGVVLYMRFRAGQSAAAGDGSSSSQDQSVPYGSGYDTGFSAGELAGENSVYHAPTQTAPKGSQYCRGIKAPNGHTYRVCGLGHWVSTGHRSFKWVHGPAPKHSKYPHSYPIPTTTRTVRAA